MRAALALALIVWPALAQAAIRPAQAEIVVEDARDPGGANLDLDLKEGRRTAFHLACRSDGKVVGCVLSRKGQPVARVDLDPNAALAGGPRQVVCQAAGVTLTLSASDQFQTLPAPIADSYRFRVSAAPGDSSGAGRCG